MISMLDISAMTAGGGAPSFRKTLDGYATGGHEVELLYLARGHDPRPDLPNGVSATPIKGIPAFLKTLSRRLGGSPGASASRVARRETPRGYVVGGPRSHVENAKIKLEWAMFQVRVLGHLRQYGPGDFDVVYGYDVHAFPVAAVASRRLQCPLVSRFQGTILGPMLQSWQLRLQYFEHVWALSIRSSTTIMTNDGTQGDRVLRELGVPPKRIHFWRNGIDLALFRPARGPSVRKDARRSLGLPAEATILLFASRLVYWKRLDRALELLCHLRARVPDILLVVVGDGTDRARLEAEALRMGVSGSVRFVGAVAHSEMPVFYQAADAFGSLYDLSNVGNPLFEAMATALPVVTLATGGTSDVIQDGVNGILLPDWDAAAAATLLASALGDPRYWAQLRSNSRSWTATELESWPARMAKEVAIVERLASRR